jgi:glycosyltransferase involved in cell wall biosynthesis
LILDKLKGNKIVISTLSPIGFGGVHRMIEFVVRTLSQRGFQITVAYYEPYGIDKNLSVPFFRLFTNRPKLKPTKAYDNFPSFGIGAWLPELEFAHYWPSKLWRGIIQDSDFHICVSGSSLAALHFSIMNKPFLAWIATPFNEDRENRVKTFPWYRQLLDFLVDKKISSHYEKRILQSGTILPLSKYTSIKLEQISNRKFGTVLHMPINTQELCPDSDKVNPYLIGFIGRITDARKNIILLLKAIKICKKKGFPVHVNLIGEKPNSQILDQICQFGIENEVTFTDHVPRNDLVKLLQKIDVFVIPSYQEGLCIAGLEAMACGCPVITTRCGGPEDYVLNNINGYLVDFDEEEMAETIIVICKDREKRFKMGKNAVETIMKAYSEDIAQKVFWTTFEKTFCNKYA